MRIRSCRVGNGLIRIVRSVIVPGMALLELVLMMSLLALLVVSEVKIGTSPRA